MNIFCKQQQQPQTVTHSICFFFFQQKAEQTEITKDSVRHESNIFLFESEVNLLSDFCSDISIFESFDRRK